MMFLRTTLALLLGALLLATPGFAARTHHAHSSHHHVRHHHYRRHHVIKGQRAIQPGRAREIQDALIREHYLTAPASGQWDSTTEAAMQKYQADHGWQTKLTPDSRALIKLGLGPKNDHVVPAAAPTASAAPAQSDEADSDHASDTLADAHSLPDE